MSWFMRYGAPGIIAKSCPSLRARASVIEADQTQVTPEIARYLMSMRLPDADSIRADELSEKARLGTLTEAETAELDSYLHIGSLLGVLQERAGRLLKNNDSLSRQ